MIETILYALASSLGFSHVTLSGSLSSIWHICILTPFLGGGGSLLDSVSYLSFPLFPPPPWWNLMTFASVLFMSNPSFTHRHQQELSKINIPCHFPTQNPLESSRNFNSNHCPSGSGSRRGAVKWRVLITPGQKHLCQPTHYEHASLPTVSGNRECAYRTAQAP